MSTYEPSEDEYLFAEANSWHTDSATGVGHLFRAPDRTMCGIELAVTAPASSHRETPCRDCINTVDPAASAALVDDELPMGFPQQ